MNSHVNVRDTEAISIGWTLLAGLFLWLLIVLVFIRFIGNRDLDAGTPAPIDAQLVEMPASARAATRLPEKHPEKKPPTPILKSPPEPVPQVVPRPESTQNTDVKPSVDSPPAATPAGARAIYQPIPKIPEELRYEALRAEAVARFHIDVNGTVTVELIKPTSNPLINQIILNTLRTWKFFPALQNGTPVPSVQEIKIHVEVS